MSAQFARTPHRGSYPGGAATEPHAALLIDFDNVTMGIRSDLTKELKNLLNSAIIKGKVAVQRAYADWRRYPQYIVPLAESSVDLIFAPAYGSAKKNATDIRLAIDAMELVFTRPEIGTIILLSGDSDFSSLVLKLKEYGKYVIGVGIRESASDLLVQNCDEYYSYSALTGLTRAGEELPPASDDPWELVEMAMKQMVENSDVMRSDRLKQVLLELDPGFDEKALGFQKFNKFLQEAATRGLLSLRKQENGQFEVGPPGSEGDPIETLDTREGRPRRSRRGGRGRHERGERERAQEEQPAAQTVESAAEESAPEEAAPAPRPPVAQVVEEVAAPQVQAEPARRSDGSRTREPRAGAVSVERAAKDAPAAEEAAPAAAPATDLSSSYALLKRAVQDIVRRTGGAARDSDIKRRMLEIQPGWDESTIGFSKFSRFLRQAHDAEAVTLRKSENGNYDVMPGNTGDAAFPAPRVETAETEIAAEPEARAERPERERGRGRDRGRRRDRDERAERAPRAEGATQATEPAPAPAELAAAPAEEPKKAPDVTKSHATSKPSATTQPSATSQPSATTKPASASTPAPIPAAMGFRRGSSRGRMAPSGPPPLLEGQTAGVSRAAAAPVHVQTDAFVTPAKQEEPAAPTSQATAPATPAKAAKKSAPRAASPGIADLGLPKGAGEIASYIASTYKGVGPKSVQTLIEKFGAGKVFDTLESHPDRVREAIGAARADQLLDAFNRDVRARRKSEASQPAPAKKAVKKAATKTRKEAEPKESAPAAKKAGGRRPPKKTRRGAAAAK